MFCGQSNQAVLKRVLLAYARWNKAVGYCQGFNMLAALILQVMDRNEPDSVKVSVIGKSAFASFSRFPPEPLSAAGWAGPSHAAAHRVA